MPNNGTPRSVYLSDTRQRPRISAGHPPVIGMPLRHAALVAHVLT